MKRVIAFTGKTLSAFDRLMDATCIVRNELNGLRIGPKDVLREKDGHVSKREGTPYQPRRFPPGLWKIAKVVWDVKDVYDPVFLRTDAYQFLDYWELDKKGKYFRPTGKKFQGYGYGIHHAKLWVDGILTPSTTTLGCINILNPKEAEWIGQQTEKYISRGDEVFIQVRMHDDWEE